MPNQAYAYILASTYKHLYIGISTNIEQRIAQHKDGTYPNSFTSRYRIDQLVHLETFAPTLAAIAREKQLKRWSRTKKISLIVSENPTWRDLSQDWGQPIVYIEPTPPAS